MTCRRVPPSNAWQDTAPPFPPVREGADAVIWLPATKLQPTEKPWQRRGTNVSIRRWNPIGKHVQGSQSKECHHAFETQPHRNAVGGGSCRGNHRRRPGGHGSSSFGSAGRHHDGTDGPR